MTILDEIIADKKIEVSIRKKLFPVFYLEKSPLFEKSIISLSKCLLKSKSGIISEHKRRSPSKQNINNSLSVIDVVKGYDSSGVCGISILTDGKYFGGSLEDLNIARASTKLPLLRKDFVIDEFQIIEAKAHGADVILLIASILNQKEIKHLSTFAKSLDLEVLLEVHDLDELTKSIMPSLDLIGVNNRNLKNFQVNLGASKRLAEKIPDEFIKVSESGISSSETIIDLKTYGYKGFLVGENFMKTDNPGKSAFEFIKKIENEI
mgnify:FL=1|tara:strand:+ start:297 stop:1088 length:792 start_codon:yes stop_codon:yes gene_type:complete